MNDAPKPELSDMEKAWEELSHGPDMDPKIAFFQGWIARGFHTIDQMRARADAVLNFDSKTHE